MADKPIQKFRIGYVEAAIWDNEKFFSVTLNRTYKEGDEYKNSDSFNHGDLLNTIKVLERCEAWIATQ